MKKLKDMSILKRDIFVKDLIINFAGQIFVLP